MAISETKMQMVIANYFKDECDVNTSIRQAFEKGFRIGVKKGVISTNRPQGEWIELGQNKDETHNICCGVCGVGKFKSKGHARSYYTRQKFKYCPNCGAKMKGADDE